MKTTSEMIEVMQAYINEAAIECSLDGDYRIESEYAPYTDVYEIERNKWLKYKADNEHLLAIIELSHDMVQLSNRTWCSFEDAFSTFVYEDGAPFGKRVGN